MAPKMSAFLKQAQSVLHFIHDEAWLCEDARWEAMTQR